MGYCLSHRENMLPDWKFCPKCGGVLTNTTTGKDLAIEPGLFDEHALGAPMGQQVTHQRVEQIILSEN